MFFIILVGIFALSLFVGSFLNVVIDRVFRGEQFFKGSSYCESCKHGLGIKDLVPIFSFIYRKGKCGYCGSSIPWIHPVVELSTAVMITVIFSEYPILESVVIAILSVLLFLIFFTDLLYYVIPDVYLYLLGGIYVFLGILYGVEHPMLERSVLATFYFPLESHLYAGFIVAVFFMALHFGSKGKAMGEGDIYLSAILALFLGGWLSVVMLFISFLTGAIVGVILVTRGRKRMGQTIPFGPFLIFGAVVSYLVGYRLINLYLGLL